MIHKNAFALRPLRIDEKRTRFIHYEATTFPENPYAGCELYLRRAAICGSIMEDGPGDLGIDVLDDGGDILQTFTVCSASFEYLRRKLKFRRESGAA
jgi:hypothetical protein